MQVNDDTSACIKITKQPKMKEKMKNKLLHISAQLKNQAYKPKDYTVVFGDDSAYTEVSRSAAHSVMTSYALNNDNTYVCVFNPKFGELLVNLISWRWKVAFFINANEIDLNWMLPHYIQSFFKKHVGNYKEIYESLYEAGQFKIYGREDLTKAEELIDQFSSCQSIGSLKKDLRKFGYVNMNDDRKIENVILIDYRCYVPGMQYPPLGLSDETYLGDRPPISVSYDEDRQEKITCYIMGALSQCKKLLEEHRCDNLRAALEAICLKPKDYLSINYEPHSGPNTKWFLSPASNPDENQWIKEGFMVLNDRAFITAFEDSSDHYNNIMLAGDRGKDYASCAIL